MTAEAKEYLNELGIHDTVIEFREDDIYCEAHLSKIMTDFARTRALTIAEKAVGEEKGELIVAGCTQEYEAFGALDSVLTRIKTLTETG